MRLMFCFLCLYISLNASCQDLKEEFRKFRSSQEQAFLQEQQRQDSIFAQTIRENWQTINLFDPVPLRQEAPKPVEQPEQEGAIFQENYQGVPQPIKLRSFEPPKLQHLDIYPEEDRVSSFGFYGEECSLMYPSQFILDISYESSQNFVSDFWSAMNQTPYEKVVNDLLLLKDQLNLPGYGLYLLIKDFVDEIPMDAELRIPYQWFLLLKSGYQVRIGFDQEEARIIAASDSKIYRTAYFKDAGTTFYVLGKPTNEISSYSKIQDPAVNRLDFTFSEPADLPLDANQRIVEFEHGGTSYRWTLHYNLNVIKLLEAFPLVEIPSYLRSHGSYLLEKSLKKAISSQLNAMNEAEKLSFLLSLVQKAFEYQTDELQFGEEKIMFPDQFLHYAKSDCDDRVVFMNYLIQLFTDLKTVAIVFPQHVALGVKLPAPTYGETVDFNGNRFTFCDPTYYNAPVGVVIPQADRKQLTIISY